jgi:opacity protein-like surface antigen
MRSLKIALLATVATAALSSATFAADLIISEPVIDTFSAGFDWEGAYAGLWIGGLTNPGVFALGADLGVNVLIDSSLLAGIEGNVDWQSDSTWEGQVHGRLGVVADSALFYGLVGVGAHSAWGVYVPVGVGVEFGVADNLSLKAEYNYQFITNRHVGKVGFNWHF